MKPEPGSFESFFSRDAKTLFEEYWPNNTDRPRHPEGFTEYLKEKYPDQWLVWRVYRRLVDGS